MQISPELIQYVPLVPVMLFCAYIFWRQRKEQKRRAELLSSLKKGDRVVTIGGMLGIITALNKTIVTLKVAEKVEVDYLLDAVSKRQAFEKHEIIKKQKPERDANPPNKNTEQANRATDIVASNEVVVVEQNTDISERNSEILHTCT